MTMHHGLVDQASKFKKRVASLDTSQYKVVKKYQLVVGFPIDEAVLSFQTLYDEAMVSPAYDVWDMTGGDVVESRYLERFLRSSRAIEFYVAKLRGTTARRRSLPDDIFLALPVPLPPLPDQRRIADLLDHADSLRSKRRAALAQLEGLNRAVFVDLFGEPGRQGGRWPIVLFEQIVTGTRLGLVRGSAEFGIDYPFPYVRMNAITRNGELDLRSVQRTHATASEVENYRLKPGDFLFNTRNSEDLVGKTALFRGNDLCLFNNNIMRIRFGGDVDPEYVAGAFQTTTIQKELRIRKSGTTNVFAIYYKDLRTLPLPLPPIQIQREYARRVSAVERLKAIYHASSAHLDTLFTTIQQSAFRGD